MSLAPDVRPIDYERRNGLRDDAPLLLGHRGARAYAPENTLAAFDLAIAQGCDGFEFDLRLTADGCAVVCHDPRIAGKTIAKSSYDALRSAKSDLPLLEDVLARYQQDAYLYIELKVTGLEKIVLDGLHRFPAERGFVVASFFPEIIQRVHENDAEVPLGLIANNSHDLAQWRNLPVTHVMADVRRASKETITELHQARKQVFAWTVNNASKMLALREYGVDGILADDTESLNQTLRHR